MSYDPITDGPWIYKVDAVEQKSPSKYPCEDCCKADVCGIQESIKNSIDEIMDVCKNADPNIVVKPFCKRFLKTKESKKNETLRKISEQSLR